MSDSDPRDGKRSTDPRTITDPYAPTHIPSPARAPVEPPEADPLIGQRVGDYVIMERLGVGGMGVVYAALQPVISKPVAVKVLRPEVASDPQQAERLLHEARTLAKLRHPGIVDIFTVGRLPDGRQYFVMELLHGEGLHEHLRRRESLSPAEALVILDKLMSSLGAAHQASLIHRDLKPSNLFLVTHSDGTTELKVLDFGLAKQTRATTGSTPQTRTDVFVGTPEYMAPEQARGAEVGPFTDLYSAGVILFELLTGRPPFVAASPIDLIVEHLETAPPPPSRHKAGIPASLDELTLRLLAKEPSLRPSSTDEVRLEISRIQKELAALADAGIAEPRRIDEQRGAYLLKLGTRFELGLSWITPSLQELEQRQPQRTIQLCFGDSAELIRQLRDAQLDCAVTSVRLRAAWIRRMELHDETYALVIGASAYREGILSSPSDAKSLALLDTQPDLPLFRYFADSDRRAQQWQFRKTELLGTIAAVRHRVLDGAGVAVLPTYFIQRDLEQGSLVRLFPELSLQKDCFRLIWRDGHPREEQIRELGRELQSISLR